MKRVDKLSSETTLRDLFKANQVVEILRANDSIPDRQQYH